MKVRRSALWLALPVVGMVFLGCRMNRAPILGPVAGRLLPCPSSPNCVCSQDADASHQIAPFPLHLPAAEAMARLRSLVLAEPRTRIVDERAGYLRADFRSALFRFVDDVEFLLDEPGKVIHVRAASRVGYSDLGVNRKRIERLREAYSR